MDTEYIREYVRVASEGSMTKAAVQLNISQPGLSKHMVALEKCVGGELLQRSSTGVTPTPLGRAFLEKAYDILRVYDGAMDYMAKMRDSKPLHLRVNALSDCALSDDLLSSVDMELGQCGYSLDLDVQDIQYALYAHYREDTANPAVPLAVDVLNRAVEHMGATQ